MLKKKEMNNETVVAEVTTTEENVNAENATAPEVVESVEGEVASDNSHVNESEALESTETEPKAKDDEAQPDSSVNEEKSETELEAKDDENATSPEAEDDTKTEAAEAETVEDELPEGTGPDTHSSDEVVVEVTEPGQVLTGNFKVYRGRNISTITAMCSTVVRDGDEILENGVKWLPVVFNNKAGTLSRGFIIIR